MKKELRETELFLQKYKFGALISYLSFFIIMRLYLVKLEDSIAW